MKPEVEDRSYPLFGKVPLPPVMIAQLDIILTLQVLQPLRKKVLEDFQKIILSNKPSTWMTVYLITFMSLHSCAKVSEENYQNARKHGFRVSTATCCLVNLAYNSSGGMPCPYSFPIAITQQMSFLPITTIGLSLAIHSKWIGRDGMQLRLRTCRPETSTFFNERSSLLQKRVSTLSLSTKHRD
jgi:hypothetical protein